MSTPNPTQEGPVPDGQANGHIQDGDQDMEDFDMGDLKIKVVRTEQKLYYTASTPLWITTVLATLLS